MYNGQVELRHLHPGVGCCLFISSLTSCVTPLQLQPTWSQRPHLPSPTTSLTSNTAPEAFQRVSNSPWPRVLADSQTPKFGRPTEVRGAQRPVRSIAWSCDGRKVAVGTEMKGLRVYDVRSSGVEGSGSSIPSGSRSSPHNGHISKSPSPFPLSWPSCMLTLTQLLLPFPQWSRASCSLVTNSTRAGLASPCGISTVCLVLPCPTSISTQCLIARLVFPSRSVQDLWRHLACGVASFRRSIRSCLPSLKL